FGEAENLDASGEAEAASVGAPANAGGDECSGRFWDPSVYERSAGPVQSREKNYFGRCREYSVYG
ncbi:unnamed protein product, partial [Pylaiella littoralis]